MSFDNDEVLEGGDDDEDLKNDPVSLMDMQVHSCPHQMRL